MTTNTSGNNQLFEDLLFELRELRTEVRQLRYISMEATSYLPALEALLEHGLRVKGQDDLSWQDLADKRGRLCRDTIHELISHAAHDIGIERLVRERQRGDAAAKPTQKPHRNK
jgi:hypothetical protein